MASTRGEKRYLLRLLAAVFVVSLALPAVAWGQSPLSDVPVSHWAYEAVRELVDKGYLAAEDGRFGGEESVDRFTLATVVARILREIETGELQPQSRQDVELLRQLVTEFRAELVQAFDEIEAVEKASEANVRSIATVDAKVSEILAIVADLEAQTEQLADRLDRRLADVEMTQLEQDAALSAEVTQLNRRIAELNRLLDEEFGSLREEQTQSQGALREEVLELVDSLRQTDDQLIDRIDETARRVDFLQEAIVQDLREQGGVLGDLEGQLSETATAFSTDLARIRSELEAELSRIDSSLQQESVRIDLVQSGVNELHSDLFALRAEIDEALAEVRGEIYAQSEGLLAQQLVINDHASRLDELVDRHDETAERLAVAESAIVNLADLSSRIDSVESQVVGVERQLLAMQSQIGLSEEQLSALSDRLTNDLESQFQHSFLLARTLAEDLEALEEEFRSYRQSTESDLASARQAQTFAIIGALLGLIGLASN